MPISAFDRVGEGLMSLNPAYAAQSAAARNARALAELQHRLHEAEMVKAHELGQQELDADVVRRRNAKEADEDSADDKLRNSIRLGYIGKKSPVTGEPINPGEATYLVEKDLRELRSLQGYDVPESAGRASIGVNKANTETAMNKILAQRAIGPTVARNAVQDQDTALQNSITDAAKSANEATRQSAIKSYVAPQAQLEAINKLNEGVLSSQNMGLENTAHQARMKMLANHPLFNFPQVAEGMLRNGYDIDTMQKRNSIFGGDKASAPPERLKLPDPSAAQPTSATRPAPEGGTATVAAPLSIPPELREVIEKLKSLQGTR